MTDIYTARGSSVLAHKPPLTPPRSAKTLSWRTTEASTQWRIMHDDDQTGYQVVQAHLAAADGIGPSVDPAYAQTIILMSGVVTVQVSDGARCDVRTYRPGAMVSIPAGQQYLLRAASLEGAVLVIVRVRALIAEGGQKPDRGLRAPTQSRVATSISGLEKDDTVALHRATEAAWALGSRIPMPQDFHAFDATLLADPSAYRVGRVGPFEYVAEVEPVSPAMTPAVGDQLAKVGDEHGLPVYLEGSQSPLSVKPPCKSSDVDILVAIDSVEELRAARVVARTIAEFQPEIPAPIAAGIVLRSWLTLPNFYSAVKLGHAVPDRQWWEASPADRLAEACRRIQRGLAAIKDGATVAGIQEQTFAILRQVAPIGNVREVRLVPRWLGLEKLPVRRSVTDV